MGDKNTIGIGETKEELKCERTGRSKKKKEKEGNRFIVYEFLVSFRLGVSLRTTRLAAYVRHKLSAARVVVHDVCAGTTATFT